MIEKFTLTINGKQLTGEAEPNWTLLTVLREVFGLTGAKCGCSTGDCGACKVIVDKKAVPSCTIQVKNAVGKQIETIEGLSDGTNLHPIQEAFVEAGAVQCGYCTPGLVLTAKALLDQTPNPTTEEIKTAISSNLCRCTGYIKVIEAIRLAAEKLQ